jgi:hypothetical protein
MKVERSECRGAQVQDGGGKECPLTINEGLTNVGLPVSGRALLAGEDHEAYNQFLAQVVAFVCPANIFEEIWVRDVVDHSWEVARLRRLKDELISSNAHRGLRPVLDALLGCEDSQDLVVRWAAKEPEALKEVERTLAAAGMSQATVMANTLAALIHEVAEIDKLAAHAEARRNATIRDIGNYRSTFATSLRNAVEEVEVTDFKVLPQHR